MNVNPLVVLLGVQLGATACDASDRHKATFVFEKRRHCLDHFCVGNVVPTTDAAIEEPGELNVEVRHLQPLKFSGQWFIGPKEYFSGCINGQLFQWWDRKPLSQRMRIPAKLQRTLDSGRGDDFSVSAVVDFGSYRFLDMLMGAVQGRPFPGTTNAAQFNADGLDSASNEHSFNLLEAV